MEAKEYFRERARMFKSLGRREDDELMCVGVRCSDCPMFGATKCLDNTEEAVDIVEKWSKEHPIKTIKQDFLEKYPKAEKYDDGRPAFCAEWLGYKVKCDDGCRKCWDTPLEVE